MISLEEFDRRFEIAAKKRQEARNLLADAKEYENTAIKQSGVEYVERDPGFDCWGHEKVDGWFPSARAALESAWRETK